MDSGDENEEFTSWRGVPGMIILINVFDKRSLKVSYAATCSLVKQFLRLSGSNSVGICLYGIENNSTSNVDSKNFDDIFALTAPTLDDFKKLQDVDLDAVVPAKELILSDILWHCSKMFANFKKQLSTRTVVMLTRLDIPPVEADQSPTFTRVVDLANSNVNLKIINVAEEIYEIHAFYKDFLLEANKGNEYELPKPIWNVKDIHRKLYQQSNRHLAVARLTLEIGNSMSIGVGIYNLVNTQGYNLQKKVDIDRETNAVLTSVTKTMKCTVSQPGEEATSSESEAKLPLLKSELVHYQTFGGEKVLFTDSEMKMLKNPFGPPTMKLLGFKPITILCREKWYFKPGQFLFPSESKIEGSTVAFKAMHKACTDLKMIAICALTSRVNSKPKIVALAPCSHPLNLDVEIGFDIIDLPFVENVRDFVLDDDEDLCVISDSRKKVMKDVITKVKFDYKADMFENPSKESEYRAIEAIALDEEDVEPFVDTTKPSPEKFEVIDSDLFIEMFGPFSVKPDKRSAASESGPRTKKIKTEVLSIDEDLLLNRINSGTVEKYTVAQLNQILTYKNQSFPSQLRKKELVDLVYKYCK